MCGPISVRNDQAPAPEAALIFSAARRLANLFKTRIPRNLRHHESLIASQDHLRQLDRGLPVAPVSGAYLTGLI
jgi:hypothetical protein